MDNHPTIEVIHTIAKGLSIGGVTSSSEGTYVHATSMEVSWPKLHKSDEVITFSNVDVELIQDPIIMLL